jgi:hypothetical protein
MKFHSTCKNWRGGGDREHVVTADLVIKESPKTLKRKIDPYEVT